MTSTTLYPPATANLKHPNLKHYGPPLWLLAILYTVLFIAGLFPVTMYGGLPYWPGPWETPAVITTFFQTQTTRVLACIFLQTGATICLGLFTAVVVSRLQFLGIRAAGVTIALFGGFLCVFDSMAASFTTWTLIRPAVAANPQILVALNYLAMLSAVRASPSPWVSSWPESPYPQASPNSSPNGS